MASLLCQPANDSNRTKTQVHENNRTQKQLPNYNPIHTQLYPNTILYTQTLLSKKTHTPALIVVVYDNDNYARQNYLFIYRTV